MAITAKKSFTLKKKDLATSKVPAVGFRKTVAYHKATAGDTSINLTALTLPTEMSSAGYSNPTVQTLLAADLTFYRDNLALISSARGYLQPGLSYNVTSNTNIVFSDSFGTALADEIFTIIIDPIAKTGTEFVDGVALPVTGSLAAGVQDFNIGVPFEANKFPTTQVGVYQIFYDGVLQSRNVGNATASPSADGNYQEVAGTGGLASLIRFNVIDNDNAHDIKCIPVGLMIERPSGSTRAELERQQGQINKIVEVLSDVAGTPESTFTAAPSEVDLKNFGDRVLGLEQPGSPGVPLVATPTVAGAVKRNKYQQKTLATSTSSTGVISSLTFNNLTIGKLYRVSGLITQAEANSSANIKRHSLEIRNGSTRIGYYDSHSDATSNVVTRNTKSAGVNILFIASNSVVDVNVIEATNTILSGTNSAPASTFLILEEVNNYDVTTDWT